MQSIANHISLKRFSAGTVAGLFLAVQMPLFLLATPNVSAASEKPKKETTVISAPGEETAMEVTTPEDNVLEMMSADKKTETKESKPQETTEQKESKDNETKDKNEVEETPVKEKDTTPVEEVKDKEIIKEEETKSKDKEHEATETEVVVTTPAKDKETTEEKTNNGQPSKVVKANEAGGGNEMCPAGTTEFAKFNFNGTYKAESGGNLIEVEGDANGGTFTVIGEGITVTNVIVKGSTDATNTETSVSTGETGTFSDEGLVNGGGNTPGISNVKFCGNPTVVEEEEEEEIVTGGIGGNGGNVLGANIVVGNQNAFTPQVLGASTTAGIGGGSVAGQLVDTGDTATTNLLVGLMLVAAAGAMSLTAHRRQTV